MNKTCCLDLIVFCFSLSPAKACFHSGSRDRIASRMSHLRVPRQQQVSRSGEGGSPHCPREAVPCGWLTLGCSYKGIVRKRITPWGTLLENSWHKSVSPVKAVKLLKTGAEGLVGDVLDVYEEADLPSQAPAFLSHPPPPLTLQ